MLFAAAVGAIVINVFAPQTLVGEICHSLGIAESRGGLIPMATLLGYAAGLFLLVPLADLQENRRLIVQIVSCAMMAAGCAALAPNAPVLLVCLFVLGTSSAAIQILVPGIASMAPEAKRGQVLGNVMSGLMIGILLSRPIASYVGGTWGWRVFYGGSAVAMGLLALVLMRYLPLLRPAGSMRYGALIVSLGLLLWEEPVLRRRALSAGLVMAAFSLFWTAVALRLSAEPFSFSPAGIALFALVGAVGAVAAPVFGWMGDRGWARRGTLFAQGILPFSFAIAAWAGATEGGEITLPLLGLGTAAVFLDIGVTGDHSIGRRAINLLRGEARGRLNGLFVGLFFLGGSVGAGLAGYAWVNGGWTAVCLLGVLFSTAALAVGYFTEPRGQ